MRIPDNPFAELGAVLPSAKRRRASIKLGGEAKFLVFVFEVPEMSRRAIGSLSNRVGGFFHPW